MLFCPSKEADTKKVTTHSAIFNEDEFFFQKPESLKEITHGCELESEDEEPVVGDPMQTEMQIPTDDENHLFPNKEIFEEQADQIRLPIDNIPMAMRRSDRERRKPSYFDGYVSGSEFDEAAYSEELCFYVGPSNSEYG